MQGPRRQLYYKPKLDVYLDMHGWDHWVKDSRIFPQPFQYEKMIRITKELAEKHKIIVQTQVEKNGNVTITIIDKNGLEKRKVQHKNGNRVHLLEWIQKQCDVKEPAVVEEEGKNHFVIILKI